MSILIKGMEMPKYCDIDCPIFPDSICPVKTIIEMKELGDNRHPNCPLVPVPPHGRLIDADALWAEINKICDRRDSGIITDLTCLQQILSALRHAPNWEGENS